MQSMCMCTLDFNSVSTAIWKRLLPPHNAEKYMQFYKQLQLSELILAYKVLHLEGAISCGVSRNREWPGKPDGITAAKIS